MSTNRNPYVGPRTFTEEERDRFFGREREANELLARVLSEQEIVFYAQSGAGKSSLVNTFLIPDLRKNSFEVLLGRVGGEAPVELAVDNIFVFNLLRSLATSGVDLNTIAKVSLTEFLAPVSEGRGSKRRALIIDQFEEIFSTHHEAWEKRREFFEQLAQALEVDPRLRVILVMREDYIAYLDPYATLSPSQFGARYYMQRLERVSALKAVKGPVAGADFLRPYAADVAEKLVDDLRSVKVYRPDGTEAMEPGQYVEPVQLQVVCYNLWEDLSRRKKGGKEITLEDLQEVGDVSASLANYYAARVKSVAEAKNIQERKIREWFTDKLISPGGIRNMVLQESDGESGGLENDVIRALSDLVRAETRGGATFYELTHDRLVEPILVNNQQWFDEHLSALQKQAALWDSEGRKDSWLLADDALADVEKRAREHPDEVGVNEREFLAACQNLQKQLVAEREAQQRIRKALQTSRIIAGIASLLLVVAIFLGVQSYQNQRSTEMQVMLNASAVELSRDNKELATRLAYQALVNYGDHGEAEQGLANIIDPMDSPVSRKAPLVIPNSDIGVRAVAFLPHTGDQTLAAGYADGNIFLVDVATRQPIGTPLAGHTAPVTGLSFSPDGLTLASSSEDGTIIIWDLATHDIKTQLTGHSTFVTSIAFSPDGLLLASGSYDNTVILWDMESLLPIGEPLRNHTAAVTSVAFNADGNVLATGSYDQTIILWDVSDSSQVRQIGEPLRGHADWVNTLAFSPDGKTLASGGGYSDKSIILWDVADVRNVKQIGEPLTGHTYEVSSLVFNPDGKTIASVGRHDYYSLIVWDTATHEPIGQPVLQNYYESLTSIAFSPDGRTIATGLSYKSEIRLWDATTLEKTASITELLPENITAAQSMSVSPDGDIVALAESRFLLWNSQMGLQEIGATDSRLTHPNYQLESIQKSATYAFSPDGRLRVDGGSNRASLSDVTTGNIIASLRHGGPSFSITAVAFSPNGNYIASGDNFSVVRVWEVKTRRQIVLIRTAKEEASGVVALTFSPDASRLAIAYADAESTVEVWDVPSKQKVFVVSNRQQKNLSYTVVSPVDRKPTGALGVANELPANTESQGELVGNPIADIHYSQDGLFILYENGVVDQWDIWPSRADLMKAAETICEIETCTLGTTQRMDYGLYSWPMRVHDNAGYIIIFLYALFYAVCLWQVRQTVFKGTRDQVAPHGFSWRKFLLAIAQGIVLILIGILIWYFVTNIEDIYYFQEETRYSTTDSLVWLALPLGLWTGGVYSHLTRLQSDKRSIMKRLLLGTLAGAIAGVVAGLLVSFLIPFSTTRSFAATVSNPTWILQNTPVFGGLSSVMSLLGSILYIFWLFPWSEGKPGAQAVGLHLLFGVGLFFTDKGAKRKWIYPIAVAGMLSYVPLVLMDLDYNILGWDIIYDEMVTLWGGIGFLVYLLSLLDLRRSLKAKDKPVDPWERIVELHLLFGVGLFFTNPQAKRKWIYPIAVAAMISYVLLVLLDFDFRILEWDIIPDDAVILLAIIGFIIYLFSLLDLRRSLKAKDKLSAGTSLHAKSDV